MQLAFRFAVCLLLGGLYNPNKNMERQKQPVPGQATPTPGLEVGRGQVIPSTLSTRGSSVLIEFPTLRGVPEGKERTPLTHTQNPSAGAGVWGWGLLPALPGLTGEVEV